MKKNSAVSVRVYVVTDERDLARVRERKRKTEEGPTRSERREGGGGETEEEERGEEEGEGERGEEEGGVRRKKEERKEKE